MTWIFIEPTDVWFFRDARPFATGQGHTARSFFPPSPMTMQGALRSLILGASAVDWEDFRNGAGPGVKEIASLIGSPSSLGNFAMQGPFLARRRDGKVEMCVPMPADAYILDKDTGVFDAFRPAQSVSFEANWGVNGILPLVPPNWERKDGVEERRWLTVDNLDEYLAGQSFGAIRGEELFISEPRLGIAMDYDRRRPQERMLYNTEFVRPMKDVGLLVGIDDAVKLPAPSGWLSLGGQARAGRYAVVDALPERMLNPPRQHVKILLLTPAYFDEGWQPRGGNWTMILGQAAKLAAVSLGKPQFLGGWDLANDKKRHKEMWSYVPAGSVYFFEIEQPIARLSAPFTQSPPGSLPLDKLGFGQTVMGVWEWQTVS